MMTSTPPSPLVAFLAAAVLGCSEPGSNDPNPTTTTEPAVDEADEPADESAYGCEETDLQVILPWTGPGASTAGELDPLNSNEYVLHATWLVARPGMEQEVIARSVDIVGAIRDIPGFVAASASRSERCGYLRTIGIWESDAAMYQLLTKSEHMEAVRETTRLSSTGKTTHWTGTAADARALDWEVSRAQLDAIPVSPAYQ